MVTNIKNMYSVPSFRKEALNNQVSKAHVYRMIEKGEIPTVKIGQKLLIPGWYVEQLLGEPVKVANA
jgi:excisionase family DNA binding protein